jgi:precorrin-6A/cobalt-precorrin-6A reductase
VPDRDAPRVLILGGTGEARALAALLVARFGSRLAVISSLAGRTRAPRAIAGRVRRGGFGGAAGLARYLRRARIAALVDATHPFARRMHDAAAAAAACTACPVMALRRAPWRPTAVDRWIEVDDTAGAVEALRGLGRRVFLTIGQRNLDAFAALRDRFFLVRVIEAPAAKLPFVRHVLIRARGPFAVADEIALMRRHRIAVLVAKASGGEATHAKLVAARQLGLDVVLIRRPPEGSVPAVADVAAAAEWVATSLTLDERAGGAR